MKQKLVQLQKYMRSFKTSFLITMSPLYLASEASVDDETDHS